MTSNIFDIFSLQTNSDGAVSFTYREDRQDSEQLESSEEITIDFENIEEWSSEKIYITLLNPDYCLVDRIRCMEIIAKSKPELIFNFSRQLMSKFYLAKTSTVCEYVCAIAKSNLPCPLRLECIEMYKEINKQDALEILENMLNSHSSMSQFENIQFFGSMMTPLMAHRKFGETVNRYLQLFLQDSSYGAEFKLSLLKKWCQSKQILSNFSAKAYSIFIKKVDSEMQFKLLALQALFQMNKKTKENFVSCLKIATDKNNHDNIRADAADIVIQYSADEKRFASYAQQAKNVITELSKTSNPLTTVYNDQSIHHEQSSQNMAMNIDKLVELASDCKENFESSKLQIISSAKFQLLDKKHQSEVQSAMQRINLDQFKYSDRFELSHIFAMVWNFIKLHEHQPTLEDRMLEELIEMNTTCSSGHVARLLNVLSGFGLQQNISWKDQFYAYFVNSFRKQLATLPEEDQGSILEELTDSNGAKSKLQMFLMHKYGILYPELKSEFQNYLSEDDIDLYFRQALAKLEGMD